MVMSLRLLLLRYSFIDFFFLDMYGDNMNWTGKDVINNDFLTFAITVGVLASTEAYS